MDQTAHAQALLDAMALGALPKIKNLLAFGVDLKSAIQHGVSSKSYGQMSRTPVINRAISKAWLKEQGLLSVKNRWCKAQGYTAKKKRKTSSSVPTC